MAPPVFFSCLLRVKRQLLTVATYKQLGSSFGHPRLNASAIVWRVT